MDDLHKPLGKPANGPSRQQFVLPAILAAATCVLSLTAYLVIDARDDEVYELLADRLGKPPIDLGRLNTTGAAPRPSASAMDEFRARNAVAYAIYDYACECNGVALRASA